MWKEKEAGVGRIPQGAQALTEDNKRLQEMLHSALTREAEALKRIKHLSELLSECRAADSRTPSSEQESLAQICSAGAETWEGRDSDMTSGNSQCSGNVSPSFVISPPLAVGLHNGNARAERLPSSMFGNRRNSLSAPNMPLGFPDQPSHTHTHPPEIMSGPGSPPASLLAPLLSTSSDIRKEREKPPPLVHRQISAEAVMREHLKKSTKPLPADHTHFRSSRSCGQEEHGADTGSVNKRSRTPPEQSSRKHSEETATFPSRMRTRAGSILKPGWLRRKRSHTFSHKTKPSTSTSSSSSSSTITDRFTHFLKHSSSHIKPHPLAKHIDRPWTDVAGRGGCGQAGAKYCSAVWELFQSETKYLCKQLQPLEQVYKAFLEELHFYGVLQVADVEKIFANLSELVELSSSIAKDLFLLFDGRYGHTIAPSNELILAFSMFGHKWNPVYQTFCGNMERQRGFVRALRQLTDFQEYIMVCRGHRMVQRSDLADLLIAPMQHQCHYKMLLENVLKATTDPSEKSLLTSAIKAFVVALKELEGNIAAHHRSEELLELQEMLSWPPLSSLCPDSYIPEFLSLEQQACRERLATAERQIVLSGPLQLVLARPRAPIDLHAFLLTDMVLLTEYKSKTSKRDLTRYTVYQHPLWLHQLEMHSLPSSLPSSLSSSLSSSLPSSLPHKQVLVLVERNSIHQQISLFSLQAASPPEKDKWVAHILQAQEKYRHTRHAETLTLPR